MNVFVTVPKLCFLAISALNSYFKSKNTFMQKYMYCKRGIERLTQNGRMNECVRGEMIEAN